MATSRVWKNGAWQVISTQPKVYRNGGWVTPTGPTGPVIAATYPDGFVNPDNYYDPFGAIFHGGDAYWNWPRPTAGDYPDDIQPWANDSTCYWKKQITGTVDTARTTELQNLGGTVITPSANYGNGVMRGLTYQIKGTNSGSVLVWLPAPFNYIPDRYVPVPFPDGRIRIEGQPTSSSGNDTHSIVWDPTAKKLYEFNSFRKILFPPVNGAYWTASSDMIWDTTIPWDQQSTEENPEGVIAGHVPLFPGIVKYRDIANGRNLDHVSLMGVTNYNVERAPGTPIKGTDGTDATAPLRSGELLRLTAARYNAIMATPDTAATRIHKSLAHGWRYYGMVVSDKSTFDPYSSAPSGSIRFSQDQRWSTISSTLAVRINLLMSDLEVVSWT